MCFNGAVDRRRRIETSPALAVASVYGFNGAVDRRRRIVENAPAPAGRLIALQWGRRSSSTDSLIGWARKQVKKAALQWGRRSSSTDSVRTM